MSYKRLITTLGFATCIVCTQAQQYKWTHLGPFETPLSTVDSGYLSPTGMGWIESLWVSEDQQHLLAGTITGGLYQSKDAGANWHLISGSGTQYGVLDIMLTKKECWLATGLTHYEEDLGIGVQKANLDSLQWQSGGLNFLPQQRQAIWALELINQKCYLAAGPERIYKTDDRGKSWREVYGRDQMNFRTLLKAKKGKKCFAAGTKLLRSLDAGEHWEDLTERLSLNRSYTSKPKIIQRIALCEDPNQKDRFLAAYSYGGYCYVDVSNDGGDSWDQLYRHRKIRRFDIHHAEIAVAPGNSNIVVLGAVKSYLSKDGGKSFEQMTFPIYQSPAFVHDDVRSIYLLDSLNFYLGTDGGVFYSADGGKSWKDLNGKGLCGMMAYGIGKNGDKLLLGCQDLGYMEYDHGQWTNLGQMYGDGGEVLQRDDKLYSILGGNLRVNRSSDYRAMRTTYPRTRMHPFTAKLIPEPKTEDGLYYIADHLYHFDGSEWSNLTETIDNKGYKAKAFDINFQRPDQLYFAFDQPTWDHPDFQDKFFRSLNGGKNWENITSQLPILKWRYITSISSHPIRSNEVVVSLGLMDQDEVHKVYRSTDGGESWQNWSEGLPPLETFKIQYIPESESGVLLSCVDGLYYRNSEMDSWEAVRGEIPRIAIRDFEFDLDLGLLYVATYGNGLWQLELSKDMLSK